MPPKGMQSKEIFPRGLRKKGKEEENLLNGIPRG